MKYLKSILFVVLAGVFVLQSCEQQAFEAQEDQTEVTAEKRLWWIPAVVYIIVKLSEGQWQGTTDGNDNGCKGIGNCGNHSVAAGSGQGTGTTYDPGFVGDYQSQAFFGVTQSGEVILAMDENSDPEAKAKFFYDTHVYMSPTQVIDNPDVLSELGLSAPVVIEEGSYEVFENDGIQFIKIQ